MGGRKERVADAWAVHPVIAGPRSLMGSPTESVLSRRKCATSTALDSLAAPHTGEQCHGHAMDV